MSWEIIGKPSTSVTFPNNIMGIKGLRWQGRTEVCQHVSILIDSLLMLIMYGNF